jgi:hypothetical protein
VLHESGAATATAFGERPEGRFMAATYAMLVRRRGPVRASATAAINIAGAAARAIWMTPLGLFDERRRQSAREHRHWLAAHLHGARHCSTLARPT